jgi:hypothetical protein
MKDLPNAGLPGNSNFPDDRSAQIIAARRLAERFSLPMPVAILIADLAGLGERDAEAAR